MSERAVSRRFSNSATKMLGAADRNPPRSYSYNFSLTRFSPWSVESLASNNIIVFVNISFIDFSNSLFSSVSFFFRISASCFETCIVSTDEHSHNVFDEELIQFDIIYFASPKLNIHLPFKPYHPELLIKVNFAGPEPDDRSETRVVINDDTASVDQPESINRSEFQEMGNQGSYDAAPDSLIGPIQD